MIRLRRPPGALLRNKLMDLLLRKSDNHIPRFLKRAGELDQNTFTCDLSEVFVFVSLFFMSSCFFGFFKMSFYLRI